MDRGIQSALQAAGDHAGAFLWRRLCRDLDGPLRVTTVARSVAVLRRTAEALETTATLDLVPLPDSADDEAGLGLQDRLLGCHALVARGEIDVDEQHVEAAEVHHRKMRVLLYIGNWYAKDQSYEVRSR